ncbi:prenyltransferase [Aliamphritea spongicola]|uniref:prenyltransferase n=1 Tax=Aliamphritea spongicola TaxID=707589 RepID=UPI00196B6299|nr:prenyltransferase [Aliamphritea spongicola]MBN3562784.1 prenyltransferase [Aliamphritea spongicola]
MAEKYRTGRALRPFSFAVAMVTCLTGTVAATGVADIHWLQAVSLLCAAVLLQAGVNLINDYSDLPQLAGDAQSCRLIRKNVRIAAVCFAAASAVALYFVLLRGWPALLLVLTGMLGALGYTLEPLNLKRRGYAVAAVFWLMGVLMVCGSYYFLTGRLDGSIIRLSVPVSLLTSLLLLANEIRDFEADRKQGCRTLTVREGLAAAVRLYRQGLALVVVSCFVLYLTGDLQIFWPLLLSAPLGIPLLVMVGLGQHARQQLPPGTGRFFLLFGLLYLTTL